ncbi:MAG TPA: SPFH domain-containing protein [Polyangiaceae bacterium]|jgi:regulator of protease activity HflC (stomatin/prohibitin superfamily)
MIKPDSNLLVKLGIRIAVVLAGVLVVIWIFNGTMVTIQADEIVIKQDLVGGQLHVWDTPGPHAVLWGTVTRYKRSAQLWFSAKEDEGKTTDDSIKVRFNDGGHGNISGSLRYTLPSDPNKMLALHQTYHSMEAIDHELVRQVVNKGVYMSGPLMSSRESYAEKRADLINYITDQIQNGVYRTEHDQVKTTDPLTGQEKVVDIVRPKQNDHYANNIEREEESPIQKFGMNASNITINGIDYDPVVEAQIKQQQEAIMAVQQAIVNARKAEQDALTVEQQGKAAAAKAKWDQEVEKATAVTAAEQEKAVAVTQAEKDKDVAALALETAKLNAQQTVTTAKAAADAARLAVQANNNFQSRIDAYVKVMEAWATAYGAQRQTPDVQLGGGAGGGTAAAMDVLAVKAARDLQVSPRP